MFEDYLLKDDNSKKRSDNTSPALADRPNMVRAEP